LSTALLARLWSTSPESARCSGNGWCLAAETVLELPRVQLEATKQIDIAFGVDVLRQLRMRSVGRFGAALGPNPFHHHAFGDLHPDGYPAELV
jgi:hypothetical protein